jgi:SAM-dependent methyltransferase
VTTTPALSQADVRDRNRRVWNVVAAKYAADVDDHVAALTAGQTTLLDYELSLLGTLQSWCRRAIVLQCSHGQDVLSLWKLGVAEVIGIDFSAPMLELARRKTQLLGAAATWFEADALEPPAELDGSADLVYTGKGSLPWLPALDRWAAVVARLLRPGGRLLLTEGHPLDWVWDAQASTFQIDPERGGYFAQQPIGNRDFPQSAYRRLSATDQLDAGPMEYQWTTAQIVNAVLDAGLVLDRLEEHPQPFWPKFPHVAPATLHVLPHVLVLLAHKPAEP